MLNLAQSSAGTWDHSGCGETKSLLSSRLGTIRHRVHEAANFGKHNEANESPIDRGPGRCNLPLA
jgi:hypothetical protein